MSQPPQMQQQVMQQQAMRSAAFWQTRLQEISIIDPGECAALVGTHQPLTRASPCLAPEGKDWSQPELPLARIKKIMKSEDEVKTELGGLRFVRPPPSCDGRGAVPFATD